MSASNVGPRHELTRIAQREVKSIQPFEEYGEAVLLIEMKTGKWFVVEGAVARAMAAALATIERKAS